MACDLTGGRLRPCKDAVGGIKKLHFVDFGDLGTLTFGSDDEITDFDVTDPEEEIEDYRDLTEKISVKVPIELLTKK